MVDIIMSARQMNVHCIYITYLGMMFKTLLNLELLCNMIPLLLLERFEKVFEAHKNFEILKIEGKLGKL